MWVDDGFVYDGGDKAKCERWKLRESAKFVVWNPFWNGLHCSMCLFNLIIKLLRI